jgi:hypothetical protein
MIEATGIHQGRQFQTMVLRELPMGLDRAVDLAMVATNEGQPATIFALYEKKLGGSNRMLLIEIRDVSQELMAIVDRLRAAEEAGEGAQS